MSENQRIMFKSLWLFYFIIKKNKVAQNDKCCIESAKTTQFFNKKLVYKKRVLGRSKN